MCTSSQLGSKGAERAPTLSLMNEKKSSVQTYVQTLAIITSIQDARHQGEFIKAFLSPRRPQTGEFNVQASQPVSCIRRHQLCS